MWTVDSNAAATDQIRSSFGFADNQGNQRCIAWASDDNASIHKARRIDLTTRIVKGFANAGGTNAYEISMKNLTADGWVHTYNSNNSTSVRIYFWAIGGDDITNVKAGTLTAPSEPEVAGSSTDVADVGFVPNMNFFMTTVAAGTPNTSSPHALVSIGFASSTSAQGCVAECMIDSGIVSFGGGTTRRVSLNRCVSVIDPASATGAPALEAEYLGGNSAQNGFGMRWNTITTALGGVDRPIFYLSFKGGRWDVKPQNFPTVTGNQTVLAGPTGIEFAPKGIMLFSVNAGNTIALNSTIEPRSASAVLSRLCIGSGTSPTERQVTFEGQEAGGSVSVNIRATDLASILQIRTPTSTGSSSPIIRSANLTAVGTNGYTLNHTIADPSVSGMKFFSITVGDSAVAVPVEKELLAPFHIKHFVDKDSVHPYSMGGLVAAGPYQHFYDIQGIVEKELLAPWYNGAFIEKELIAPFHISQPIAGTVEKELIAPFHIKNLVEKDLVAMYSMDEDPTLYLRRGDQGYGFRMFIMSNRMDVVYHVVNSFNPEESTLLVYRLNVDLDTGSAPECSFEVEDSAHLIDTSRVGEGCVVAIQAAKNETDLNNGKSNLFLGYIKTAQGQRVETNALTYAYTAYGTKIRFNERLTSMNKSAKRLSFNDPRPDPDDPNMKAWKLFSDLVNTTDHLPFGSPRERQFTTNGITNTTNLVDNFIASVDVELSEWSEVADDLAERSTAEWDVTPTNDIFFRYPTLEPSGVIIKDKVDKLNDDPDLTSYFIREWSWTQSTQKEDGFTNRFAATVGTKSSRANVINANALADQFEALAVDEPPSGDVGSGRPLPEGTKTAVGTIIKIFGNLVGPNSPVWTQIANLARQYIYNRFYVVIKIGAGTDGPGDPPGSPDWVNPWNAMEEASCRLLGYVDLQNGSKTIATAQAEIDRWWDLWGPYSIFFDNCPSGDLSASYVNELSTYARNRGFGLKVVANTKAQINQNMFNGCPNVATWVVYEGQGLVEPSSQYLSWYDGIDDDHRAVIATGITSTVATDADIGRWVYLVSDETSLASWVYVTNDSGTGSQPFDTLSTRMIPMLNELEKKAILVLQNNGYLVPGVPVQQDVAMSFIAESSKTDDISLILSKIGNVSATHSGEHPTSLYGEILPSRQVLKSTEDPITGQITNELVEMPQHTDPSTPLAQFWVPLDTIQAIPTPIFLHGITRRHQMIVPQRRYWVVLYGRGRDASNTVRWHKAEKDEALAVDPNYRVAIRIPSAGRDDPDLYSVLTPATHPGLALSYFKNTTHLLEASDPDSIERYGLIESKIEFPDLNDDHLVVKTLHSILHYSARPKRIYDIQQITAPNKLLFPGMLVTIVDEMAGLGHAAAGGSSGEGTEAELLSVGYEWDSTKDVGCRYLTINAVGHVDFAWQLWFGRFQRQEIDMSSPVMPAIPPGFESPTEQFPGAPVIVAHPQGGTYPTGVSVRFSADREDVVVNYTLDGSVPANSASASGPTRAFKPGTTGNIRITSTTLVRYKGIDQGSGKMSAIYAQEYRVPQGQPIPPGGGQPPVGAGSKMMWVLFRQMVDLNTVYNTFAPHLNSGVDCATLQKLKDEPIDSNYTATVTTSPTRFQDIEFQRVGQMEDRVDDNELKNNGWDIVGYNYEPNVATDAENDDVVATHKKFSDIVRKKSGGLKVRFNPDMQITKTYGSRIVRYCDYYNIQAHEKQHDLEGFRSFVKKTAASLRQNNANVFITVTMSAAHRAYGSLSVLNTLKHQWTWAKQYVDGVRIYYEDEDDVTQVVGPFMQWFKTEGRSV